MPPEVTSALDNSTTDGGNTTAGNGTDSNTSVTPTRPTRPDDAVNRVPDTGRSATQGESNGLTTFQIGEHLDVCPPEGSKALLTKNCVFCVKRSTAAFDAVHVLIKSSHILCLPWFQC